MHTYVHTYICTYLCKYVCMYIRTYVYVTSSAKTCHVCTVTEITPAYRYTLWLSNPSVSNVKN